jgi:hypothetical protein
MQSRAVRRHHEERIKHRVQKYYAGVHRGDPRRIGLIAHSRQLCSCFMCGNPRKWLDEPTRQEQLAGDVDDYFRELHSSKQHLGNQIVNSDVLITGR